MKIFTPLGSAITFLCFFPLIGSAQVIAGSNPFAVAANPVTNKIYVANRGTATSPSNVVSVIDGATAVVTNIVESGSSSGPTSVAVNPLTNKIYVANNSGDVTVIDGLTNSTIRVPAGSTPVSVAVNPAANKIYVANSGSNNVTVINGADNTTATVPTGSSPSSVALNPATNKIYVANSNSNNITVIDGVSNSTTTIAAGVQPISIAVNAVTNKVYVANYGGSATVNGSVTVVDGATNSTTNVAAGIFTRSVAVNPVTNKIYVTNQGNSGSGAIMVIDGATNNTVPLAANNPRFVAVNPTTNQIYVTDGTGTIAIDGSSNQAAYANGLITATAIAANPVTNKIYVLFSASVQIVDGATNQVSAVNLVNDLHQIAVNPVTNKTYVSNYNGNSVTVLDGLTSAITTIPSIPYPASIAVNPATNTIFVINYQGGLTAIDGNTNNTVQISTGFGPGVVAVNPVTNRIYVANFNGNNVTVIDGATYNTTTVPTGPSPNGIAVNPVTNKIYIVNAGANFVTVIDGASNTAANVNVGNEPIALDLNPVTNKVYVTDWASNDVTVIDGATNVTTSIAVGTSPYAVVVNPITNMIYVSNTGSNNTTIIDGATNKTSIALAYGTYYVIAVNPVTNKIYVRNSELNAITVIDGLTNNVDSTIAIGINPYSLAVNPITNRVYVGAYFAQGSISVITEEQVQPSPLTTIISPLANNRTSSLTPTFTFTAASTNGLQPAGVFYQVDTWQNAWIAASGSNPVFTGTTPALLPGFHILYAYAVDNQEATSTGINSDSIGGIQAYGFLVAPAAAQTISFPAIPPQTIGNTVSLTATASSGLPVTYSSTSASCTVSGNTATFVTAGSCQISAIQIGNSSYASVFPVTQTVSVVPAGTSFISTQSPGPLRNNYTGYLGFAIKVGANPLQVSSLGRLVAPGNVQNHLVQIRQVNGEINRGSNSVYTADVYSGQYVYSISAYSVTLLPNTIYYIVSQETAGGDQWYDAGPVTSSSAATVLGPVFSGDGQNFQLASGLAGQAYVPVNFIYTVQTPPRPAVSITAPSTNSTLSGNVAIGIATAGLVTMVQLQIDGYPQGSPIPLAPTINLDTTTLTNGDHSITVTAFDAQANAVSSLQSVSPLIVTISNPVTANGLTPFVTNQNLSTRRNNYTGFVGFAMAVGNTAITINSLGRFVAPNSSQTHVLKLVNSDGTDVAGGSVSLSLAGTTSGAFAYAPLSSPVTLQPGQSYFLLSQETASGDQWYDISPVSVTSVASVTAPVYSYGSGSFQQVQGLTGQSYVPLSFLYATTTASSPLSVAITSPQAGATLSGNVVPVTFATTGNVTNIQLVVDGIKQASFSGSTFISLDTTLLTNGSHSLTLIVSDALANTVTSAAVSITVNNPVSTISSLAFVTGQSTGILRNNYSGFVGFYMTIGSAPVTVTALGRFVAPKNSGTHLLKLVNAIGSDVAGGSVSVSLAGVTAGTFSYSALAAPVTLKANVTYYLMSQESAGGDQWYDIAPVSTTSVASVTAPVYTAAGSYYAVAGLNGQSYVPLSFVYTSATAGSAATITSPQAGVIVSGAAVPVTVTTTGSVTSLQLQVDGVNQGPSVLASPLTLDTTGLANGSHTLTVVASAGVNAAVSPGVAVIVSNGSITSTAFLTGETASVLRNNYSGFVGTQIKIGSVPIAVSSLGRFFAAGNSGVHTVKLVQAGGTDVPGGSVSVNMAGGTAGQFIYASLASPVSLLANTTYYVVSQESAGGDMWYDLEPVTATPVAQILGATYTDSGGNYYLVGSLPGYSYGPVSFKYQ